jgi:cytochrome c-type biogenesis protein CcmH/NrfF
MTTTTKTFLALSLTSLLISLTGVLWGLFLPVGVILFGLFLISRMLAREVALFDQEQQARIAKAEQYKTSRDRTDVRQEAHSERALSPAHSH